MLLPPLLLVPPLRLLLLQAIPHHSRQPDTAAGPPQVLPL
jgi:hypothetical protein